jgi:hypothetical protein
VVGDLNFVVFVHVLLHMGTFGATMPSGAANTVVAARVLMAYMGQWSHRMAHAPDSQRPAWVRVAQKVGFLVSPALHKVHHTDYNDGFPILSGVTAPLISALIKVMPNRYAWLALFIFLTLFDVLITTTLYTRAMGVPI